jgi:hypothetical protein
MHSRAAWSKDGLEWSYSPYSAWGASVQYTDGTRERFHRRERPHVLTDSDGFPTHLSSGVQPQGVTGDYSYTLVQPTSHAHAPGARYR